MLCISEESHQYEQRQQMAVQFSVFGLLNCPITLNVGLLFNKYRYVLVSIWKYTPMHAFQSTSTKYYLLCKY